MTAFEDGRANRRIEDERVLARAHKLGRAVLTNNRVDFRRLHESGINHTGIIICTFDADFIGQANRIHELCDAESELKKELVRVNRPS